MLTTFVIFVVVNAVGGMVAAILDSKRSDYTSTGGSKRRSK